MCRTYCQFGPIVSSGVTSDILLWCSLVEPTPYVARLHAPLPARPKSWQLLRGGENCFLMTRAKPLQAPTLGHCLDADNFCVGARTVATTTAWVHRGLVQLANTTIPLGPTSTLRVLLGLRPREIHAAARTHVSGCPRRPPDLAIG